MLFLFDIIVLVVEEASNQFSYYRQSIPAAQHSSYHTRDSSDVGQKTDSHTDNTGKLPECPPLQQP